MTTQEKLIDLTNSLCDCEGNVSEIDALFFYISEEIENLMNNPTVAPAINDTAKRLFYLGCSVDKCLNSLKETIDKDLFPTVQMIEKGYEEKP